MIVRLKGLTSNPLIHPLKKFQFYDSPIKSSLSPKCLRGTTMSFNSMIVRLKVVLQMTKRPIFIVSIL